MESDAFDSANGGKGTRLVNVPLCASDSLSGERASGISRGVTSLPGDHSFQQTLRYADEHL